GCDRGMARTALAVCHGGQGAPAAAGSRGRGESRKDGCCLNNALALRRGASPTWQHHAGTQRGVPPVISAASPTQSPGTQGTEEARGDLRQVRAFLIQQRARDETDRPHSEHGSDDPTKEEMMEGRAVLFRRTPGARPNPVRGCYTALAMFLPLIALAMLGHVAFGGQVMFGALLTAFGDVGTSSRMRTKILLEVAVGGALMTALGRLIGGPWWLEGVEIFLAVFLSGLFAAYGRALAAVGTLLTVILVLSLSTHSGPATALSSAAGFLFGGLILLLFALLFARVQAGHRAPENEAHVNRSRPTLTTLTAQLTWAS